MRVDLDADDPCMMSRLRNPVIAVPLIRVAGSNLGAARLVDPRPSPRCASRTATSASRANEPALQCRGFWRGSRSGCVRSAVHHSWQRRSVEDAFSMPESDPVFSTGPRCPSSKTAQLLARVSARLPHGLYGGCCAEWIKPSKTLRTTATIGPPSKQARFGLSCRRQSALASGRALVQRYDTGAAQAQVVLQRQSRAVYLPLVGLAA